MYWLPAVILVAITAISVAWSPLVGLVIAVPLFVLFLLYVGTHPGAGGRVDPPTYRESDEDSESDM